MKKHSIATIALVLAIIATPLSRENANASTAAKPALSYYYFKYIGSDFTEQGYLIPSNWQARGSSPGAACMQGADELPCVIYVCMPTGYYKVNDLMMFFNTIGCGNIEEYVESPNNIIYYRPEP